MNEVIPNIGPQECKKRMMSGVIMLLLSLGGLFLCIQFGVPRAWRTLLFIPNFLAALGFYQARNKTCVLLAAMKVRNLDGGNQPVENQAVLEKIRKQTETVYFHSSIAAAIITAIWLAIF